MSTLGRIGIWSMELRTGVADEVRDAATELEELGYNTLWIPGLAGQGALERAEELLAGGGRAPLPASPRRGS
jgi:hypothetical protein